MLTGLINIILVGCLIVWFLYIVADFNNRLKK